MWGEKDIFESNKTPRLDIWNVFSNTSNVLDESIPLSYRRWWEKDIFESNKTPDIIFEDASHQIEWVDWKQIPNLLSLDGTESPEI